jgi:hypothetical protein
LGLLLIDQEEADDEGYHVQGSEYKLPQSATHSMPA